MQASQPETYEFSDQIGHLLRRAYQRHMAIFQESVPDATLTPSQFVVLCTVREHSGCEVAAIARATALDEPSVRGIVERLKWRGLLDVEQEPGDGRHMKMRLTEAGRELAEKTVPFARQISELTFGDLSADERQQLLRLVRRLI